VLVLWSVNWFTDYFSSCCALLRTYVQKRRYYADERETNQEAIKQNKITAKDLLDDAARVRQLEQKNTLALLQRARQEGKIDSKTDEAQLERRALNAGFHAQATSLISRGLLTSQYNELNNAISALEHPKGAGWTEQYGNLGSGKAAQRSRNTRLEKPTALPTVENTVVLNDR
jgi:hypothetical protein